MKRHIAAAAILLTACGAGNGSPDVTTAPAALVTDLTDSTADVTTSAAATAAETSALDTEPSETEQITEEAVSEEVKFDPAAAYHDTLMYITEEICDPEGTAKDNWAFERITYDSSTADHTGYIYYDINGDGTEELIVGNADGFEGPELSVFAVYTYKDGEVYHVVDGWSRNRWSIGTDGSLLNWGSSGAAYACFGTFRINDSSDGLKCDGFWFTDSIDGDTMRYGTYHNTTGDWDVSTSELISEDTEGFYERGSDHELLELELIPFTELAADYEARTAHISVAEAGDTDTSGYTFFNTGITSEDGVKIVFSSDKGANVILVSLELLPDGYDTFDAMELFEGHIAPEEPIVTTVTFPGAIPAYGIEVTDGTGTRFYALEMSGYDGSLLLTRITVNEVEHSRG